MMIFSILAVHLALLLPHIMFAKKLDGQHQRHCSSRGVYTQDKSDLRQERESSLANMQNPQRDQFFFTGGLIGSFSSLASLTLRQEQESLLLKCENPQRDQFFTGGLIGSFSSLASLTLLLLEQSSMSDLLFCCLTI
ncbi:hypothetical protein Bca4012_041097 [Brassica carinata]